MGLMLLFSPLVFLEVIVGSIVNAFQFIVNPIGTIKDYIEEKQIRDGLNDYFRD